MPLTKRSLALPASPPSVKLARAWVSEILREIGRPELVFAAQLGVSELVTNAILHANPPLTVRVRGTAEHPRIEVTDHTPGPLRPTTLTLVDAEQDPTTFGRGLALVAMNSQQWGSENDLDGIGKTVWFEPSAEIQEQDDILDQFRLGDDQLFAEPVQPPADSVSIVLRRVPAELFGAWRRYNFELRRELRLLSLSDPRRYPIAVELTAAFRQADADRRESSGVSKLDDAIARGLRSVDLEYAVPAGAPETMVRIRELLEECYRVFASEHLLAVQPPAHLMELQRWYFGEFERQGRGEEPIAWDGPLQVSSVS